MPTAQGCTSLCLEKLRIAHPWGQIKTSGQENQNFTSHKGVWISCTRPPSLPAPHRRCSPSNFPAKAAGVFMLQEPSFLCGEERSLVLKHSPLSSTLLSPAQTRFRCPSDSPSAAVLWEALVQCPHSLGSAGWSLHRCMRQAVRWSLPFSGCERPWGCYSQNCV